MSKPVAVEEHGSKSSLGMLQARWLIEIDTLEHIIYLLNLKKSLKYQLEIPQQPLVEKREPAPEAFYLYHDAESTEIIRSKNITIKYYSVNQVRNFNTFHYLLRFYLSILLNRSTSGSIIFTQVILK
jgi:hypothetical protein